MQIVLIGINHKTAPVEVRELLAFNSGQVSDALGKLAEAFGGCEFALLSTCNRVECYAVLEKAGGPTPTDLARRLVAFRGADFEAVREHLYIKINEDAVTHLFTVSASLDSMVLGENQITAQVKECYKIACQCGTSGKVLNRLFHDAFRTTKEIITSTSIANRRVSVAGVAVELARQLFSTIQSAKVVIAGAGQMGELLVEHFLHEKCRDITVVNRSRPRGCRLAEKHGVSHQPWEQLDTEIVGANILVGAASGTEGYLFSKDRVKSLMSGRRNRSLLIIDITVPRSFDPAIAKLENVYLYSIDDLAQVAQDNIKLREGDLEQAIEMICQSVSAFMDWFVTRDIGPLMGQIRESFEHIRENEMEKFFVGPRQDAGCREFLESSMSRVVNKVCHCVIRHIDSLSKEHGAEEAEKFARGIIENAKQIISEDTKENQ